MDTIRGFARIISMSSTAVMSCGTPGLLDGRFGPMKLGRDAHCYRDRKGFGMYSDTVRCVQ